MTVQTLMRTIDPRTRFTLRGDVISTAADIASMAKVPDVEDAPIYAAFDDLIGHVVIGIAQDDASPVPADEWIDDQLAHPVLRSIDRVDIFGSVIRDLTEDQK